ncbi:unnamed protein product [Cuscuta campestris]|uniref:SWIM-type domain-containing protein n=1 Tax=Cuscuta campestris TaxID=132261 RepID=A0A484N201_9ASTE|nr:unnamed protein product [Cuscuta campestris]
MDFGGYGFCVASLVLDKPPTGFRVYVKHKWIDIEDIDLDIYFTKDLYADVISRAKEQNIILPRFIGFRYHLPDKELQREQLMVDSDWNRMVAEWGGVCCTYIPLFVIELKEPSALQKMAEGLDSSTQDYNEACMTEIEQWADNLLVTPTECGSILDSQPRSCSKAKLIVRRQNKNMRDEVQTQPSLIEAEELPSLTPPAPNTSHPLGDFLTNSSTQHSPTIAEEVDNHRTPKKKKRKAQEGGRKQFELTELNVKLLSKELKGLEAYDIPSLSKPEIPTLDIFFEEVVLPSQAEIQSGQVDTDEENESTEDDDFDGGEDSTECLSSEELSMDEKSATDDEIDVEADTANRMRLDHMDEDEDDYGNQSVVEKMAKVFRTGRLWVRSRDGKVELKVGDIFSCKEDFLRVMKDYTIQKGITLRKLKNDKRRYTHTCINENCKFRIHASVLVDRHSWMIKTLCEEHVCSVKEHHKRAGASWVASHFLEDFRSNKEMKASTLQKLVLSKFTTYIPKYTCWRAIKLMREIVDGRHEDGYKLLPQYMEVFRARNPDFQCFIRWQEIGPGRNPIFRRCQICLGSAINAFKDHCRPFIGIDACHLKGPYQGVLLTAMALDGNNGQFPLAYGVADCEDETEWSFFLNSLALALGCTKDASKYTIISDRHAGIIQGLKNAIPKASRRICVLHFYKNFAKTFTGHRGKPMLTMLEEIRKLVGNRFEKRFELGRKWSTVVTPFVDKKLRELAMDSRVCSEVVAAGRGEFDVLDGCTNFTVRLREHNCDCSRWQVTGLPCKHAARCILRLNEKLEDYCAHWFSVEKYKGLYDAIIHPIPDPCMWGETSEPNLDPPKNLKKKGRPKKHKRRDGIDDRVIKQKRTVHGTKRCGKCKQLGHNHRTCGQKRDEDGRLVQKQTKKKKLAKSD